MRKIVEEVGRALVTQAQKASLARGTKEYVVTVVSTPMWRLWCEFIGAPQSTPVPLLLIYGTAVEIVQSDEYFAFSRPVENPFDFSKYEGVKA